MTWVVTQLTFFLVLCSALVGRGVQLWYSFGLASRGFSLINCGRLSLCCYRSHRLDAVYCLLFRTALRHMSPSNPAFPSGPSGTTAEFLILCSHCISAVLSSIPRSAILSQCASLLNVTLYHSLSKDDMHGMCQLFQVLYSLLRRNLAPLLYEDASYRNEICSVS